MPVEEDSVTGELFVTFPEELLKKMNWKEGDTLNWVNNYDGTFTLKKV
jgi:bifunctional DNA-binding transcriptional regulator/antitoxin component of YhaV-PrlF toxin-antitoxin module